MSTKHTADGRGISPRFRNVLWALIVMGASIACSALWPMGYAPDYGPIDSCAPTTNGTCIAPVTDEPVTH